MAGCLEEVRAVLLGERGYIIRRIKGDRHGVGVPAIAARDGSHLVGPVDGAPHPNPDAQVDQLLHSGCAVAGINGIDGCAAILGRVGDVAYTVFTLCPPGKAVGVAAVIRPHRGFAGIGGLGAGLVPVRGALQK